MSLPSSLGAMNEEQFGGLSITKQTVLSLQVKKTASKIMSTTRQGALSTCNGFS
jgi:hypothetical protein